MQKSWPFLHLAFKLRATLPGSGWGWGALSRLPVCEMSHSFRKLLLLVSPARPVILARSCNHQAFLQLPRICAHGAYMLASDSSNRLFAAPCFSIMPERQGSRDETIGEFMLDEK
jgi:hypothetical protein